MGGWSHGWVAGCFVWEGRDWAVACERGVGKEGGKGGRDAISFVFVFTYFLFASFYYYYLFCFMVRK